MNNIKNLKSYESRNARFLGKDSVFSYEKKETSYIFNTTNNVLVNISSEFTSESQLIEYLITLKSDGPIQLKVNSDDLELIYSYMKHTKLNKPNIELIEKPAMKQIQEYFSDNWYNNFFPEILKNCQMLYNSADYLGMTDLCKIIVGHIGYKLNNLEDRNDVKNELLFPDENINVNVKKVFNLEENQFENMTEDEISKYVKNQGKNWEI